MRVRMGWTWIARRRATAHGNFKVGPWVAPSLPGLLQVLPLSLGTRQSTISPQVRAQFTGIVANGKLGNARWRERVWMFCWGLPLELRDLRRARKSCFSRGRQCGSAAGGWATGKQTIEVHVYVDSVGLLDSRWSELF